MGLFVRSDPNGKNDYENVLTSDSMICDSKTMVVVSSRCQTRVYTDSTMQPGTALLRLHVRL